MLATNQRINLMTIHKHKVESFYDFLEIIYDDIYGFEIHLFRGQKEKRPLLPAIARDNPEFDSTQVEIEMLEDLRWQSSLFGFATKNWTNN